MVLGYKPDQWEPVHSINLIGCMPWDLNSGWETEFLLHRLKNEISKEQILDLIPDLKNQSTTIFPDFNSPQISSNKTLLSAS